VGTHFECDSLNAIRGLVALSIIFSGLALVSLGTFAVFGKSSAFVRISVIVWGILASK